MNQPTPVTGYRQLAPEQVALMNKMKALGNQVGELIAELRKMPASCANGDLIIDRSGSQPRYSLDQRWVSIGATHLQEGFMALNRAVAQPSTFA